MYDLVIESLKSIACVGKRSLLFLLFTRSFLEDLLYLFSMLLVFSSGTRHILEDIF